MRLNLFNLAGFQIGWFACVLGAAAGRPWIGPIVVALVVGLHLALVPRRLPETLLIAAAAVLGYAIDSALVLGSAIEIPGEAALGGPSPVWMVALWINFAVTLHRSLAWLVERPAIGVLFGALGGPLAYWGGARLGALVLPAPSGLVAVGLAWALAMAILIVLAARTRDAIVAHETLA